MNDSQEYRFDCVFFFFFSCSAHIAIALRTSSVCEKLQCFSVSQLNSFPLESFVLTIKGTLHFGISYMLTYALNVFVKIECDFIDFCAVH